MQNTRGKFNIISLFILFVASDGFLWPRVRTRRPHQSSTSDGGEKWLKVDNGGEIFYANIETGETRLNSPLLLPEYAVPILELNDDESEVESAINIMAKLLDSILIPSNDRLNV